jgi:hypothetical protein
MKTVGEQGLVTEVQEKNTAYATNLIFLCANIPNTFKSLILQEFYLLIFV